MYTANIINKEELAGELVLTIEYSDGTNSFTEKTTTNGGFGSVDQLYAQIEQKLKVLNSKAEIASAVSVGAVVIPEKVATEKAAEEVAFETFITDYFKFKRVSEMVDLGILVGNEKEVTDLKAKVIAGYSATFFNKL